MKKALIWGLGLLLALSAVIVVRTMTFAPEGVSNDKSIVVAAAPAFDSNGAAKRLGEAIRYQTVSRQDATQNEWDQWDGLQAWLQRSYPTVHRQLTRELVAERTLIYKWQGSDAGAKPIIMMAHQDVDDKGSLVSLFEAMEALAVSGFKPRRTIWLVSGHDEEVGGEGAKAAAAFLKAKSVRALFTLDEGAAIIDDAPVINGPAIMIGIAEKGYATMKVTANATGGHSSMPPAEIGTVNLAKAVIAINSNQFPLELKPPVSLMLATLASEKGGMTKVAIANQWLLGGQVRKQIGATPTGRAMLHTTIAPTMLEGSPKENVLPQSANALVNFRIAPWSSSKEVMAHAKRSVGGLPVELSWLKEPREPSPVSSTQSQGWKLISATAQAEVPSAVVAPYLVVGGTDSRNMAPLSDDVYRFFAVRLKTKDTAMIHGTNEHMTLDNLKRMISFYARLIKTSAG
jgi:carboxypeptidase PM20D1